MGRSLHRALLLAGLSVGLFAIVPGLARADALGEVEALVRAGRNEAALVTIAEAEPAFRARPEIRYLTARLLARIGQHTEALASLPPLDALPEGVRDDVALERARWQAEVGRCEEAYSTLRARGTGRRGDPKARFAAARCAHAMGRHRDAIALTDETVARDPAGVDLLEVRVLRAEAALAAGLRKRAIAELRAAWIERPEHPEIPAVEARLGRIRGGTRSLDAEARLARVASLVDARRFSSALEAIEVLPERERRSIGARRLRGRALFSLKRYGEAARTLAGTGRGGRGPEARRDQLLAARARYRSGEKNAGLRELRRVASRHRGTYEGDLAAYLLAEVSYERGGRAGERALSRFLESASAKRLSRKAQSARFRMGLRAFEAGKGAEAARRFGAFLDSALDREQRLAGTYWRARALALAGKREAAAAAFAELAERYPFDWYGYHARRRLHAMGEASRAEPAPPPPLPELGPPPVTPSESEAVRFYRQLGLVADAEAALRRALSGEPHERLAFHVARADVRSAFLVARADRALREPASTSTRWIWEAAYPRPHREHIAEVAARAGVPEAWIYATMRQESGFHTEARSRSGAQGLLQLMPSAAEGVAASAGVDLARSNLLDPKVNVAVGVELMRRIGERVGGQLPLMAAAYNAGRGRLLSWLKEHGDAELDLFVERVPFEETRRYIKRVVSHYFVYRYLGGEPDPFEGAIPEKVERR